MAIELGTAYVQIMPSAKGIKGSVSSLLKGESVSAGEASGKGLGSALVGKLKGIIGAAAIGKFITSSIMEGAKLEQSLGGIETLYKDSAGLMKKYAAEAYKTSGLSANEYMQNVTAFSASMISSLGGDTKKAAKLSNQAMKDMSDNANKMGTDMSSITQTYQSLARGNYAMLDNLKLGYGGTKQELQRLLADAEKLTGIHYDINKFSDVTEAIHAVQTELGITGTTAKEAQYTISGSFGMMKASWKDFLGNLALGKDVSGSIKNLALSAVAFARNVVPAIGNVILGIPKAIIKNGPAIYKALNSALNGVIKQIDGGGLGKMIDKGGEIVLHMAKGIYENAPVIISAIGKLIAKAVSALAKALPTIGVKLGTFIGKLGGQIVLHLPEIISAILNAMGSIAYALIEAIGGAISGAFSAIGAIISNFFKSMFFGAFNELKAAAVREIGILKAQIASLFAPLISVWNSIKAASLAVWNGIKAVVQSAMNAIRSVILSAINTIKAAWNGLQAVAAVVTGIFNTIKAVISTAISAVVNVVRGKIDAIKGAFSGLTSIAGRVSAEFNAVKNAFIRPIQAAYSAVRSAINRIKSLFPLRIGRIGNIKIPHISVSGGKAPFGIAGKGSLPKFNISWHAEGGIFTRPTVIGNHGFGEAGAEAVLPLTRLQSMLDQSVVPGQNSMLEVLNRMNVLIDLVAAGKTIRVGDKELVNILAEPMSDRMNTLQLRENRKRGRR